MPFISVGLTNFRNLENKQVDLSAHEVFFIGENGQGKTNFLESLYLSAYGSSFRTKKESEIITESNNNFSIRSLYESDNKKSDLVSVQFVDNKKKILKNGKTLKDRKDLINTIPCVLFSHSDLDFVIGEPERKRFFIDQSLSMYDLLYIDTMRKYKKILKNRNILLKNEQYESLDVYDHTLVIEGMEIVKKRKTAIYNFNRIFTSLYEKVTGIENVKIGYASQWEQKYIEEILALLIEKRNSDKIMKTTLSGPHRDKIGFVKDSKNFVATASTGQCRLAAILLRICQAVYFTELTNKKPVLLMDDVLLELDPQKREIITSLLPEYDQLFCTFLPGEPYQKYIRENTLLYSVEKGCVNEIR